MPFRCIKSCLQSDLGGHDPLQEALAEIERLHNLLRGVECALARDGDIDAAMRLITNGKQERAE
jgi:hypothetical protein